MGLLPGSGSGGGLGGGGGCGGGGGYFSGLSQSKSRADKEDGYEELLLDKRLHVELQVTAHNIRYLWYFEITKCAFCWCQFQ